MNPFANSQFEAERLYRTLDTICTGDRVTFDQFDIHQSERGDFFTLWVGSEYCIAVGDNTGEPCRYTAFQHHPHNRPLTADQMRGIADELLVVFSIMPEGAANSIRTLLGPDMIIAREKVEESINRKAVTA